MTAMFMGGRVAGVARNAMGQVHTSRPGGVLRKFVGQVEQIKFNGCDAAQRGSGAGVNGITDSHLRNALPTRINQLQRKGRLIRHLLSVNNRFGVTNSSAA
jgi:hypothetical protein